MNKLDKFIIQGLRKKCIKEVNYKDLEVKVNSTGRVEITHLKNERFLYNFKSKMEFGVYVNVNTVVFNKDIEKFNQEKSKKLFLKLKKVLSYQGPTINKVITKEGERYLKRFKKQIIKVKKELEELTKLGSIYYFRPNEIISEYSIARVNWLNDLLID